MTQKSLFLILHGRFPSNKADSLFAAKNAEAFAEEGVTVTLVVGRRLGREEGDPYKYYNVKNTFKIVYLPVLDMPIVNYLTRIRFVLSTITFALSSYWYLLWHAKKEDIIYSNESLPLLLASASFPNIFYEMHDFPESGFRLFGIFLRRMTWVLIHNNWKADSAKKLFHMKEERILREPNAVSIEDFDISITKEAARKRVSLPQEKKIVVYTGHLYSWKGADTLARAARELSNEYLVVFVGGTPEDIEKLRADNNRYEKMLFVGWRPHEEIPFWQKAADVLVLPNTAKEDISKYYTSPMKLFEYMASQVPIVASRIPSIEEIVTDEDVFFAEADSPASFAKMIVTAVENTEEAEQKVAHAFEKVAQHTWEKRAKRVVAFIGQGSVKQPILTLSRIFFLMRYLFSGLLSFTTNLGLLFIFKEYFNMWYLTASTLSFIISVLVSFAAQKFITFRDKSRDRMSKQMVWYIAIALFNVSMNAGMMFAFVDLLHVPYLLAQVISAGCIALWSLAAYRYIIFTNA
jgi:glycosyltransferase involved in cell wall biosynthesis/putative flippase GtrA